MWRKNPIPRTWRTATGDWGQGSNQFQTGEGFQPYCEDDGIDKEGNQHSCTSEWGPYNMEIVDTVVMPANLAPGAYVKIRGKTPFLDENLLLGTDGFFVRLNGGDGGVGYLPATSRCNSLLLSAFC